MGSGLDDLGLAPVTVNTRRSLPRYDGTDTYSYEGAELVPIDTYVSGAHDVVVMRPQDRGGGAAGPGGHHRRGHLGHPGEADQPDAEVQEDVALAQPGGYAMPGMNLTETTG